MLNPSDRPTTAAALAQGVRTQLSAIVGFAEMLKLGIDDPEEMRRAVDSILASSRAMMKLVDEAGGESAPAPEDDHRRRLSTTQVIRLTVSDVATKVRRVLIADDSPVNLAVMRSMFRRFGINDVMTAENGRAALDLLTSGMTFDLVLTDMRMPEMDGAELVREIRRYPALAGLRVYAITVDEEARNSFARMGFSGILLKPLTLQKIRNIL